MKFLAIPALFVALVGVARTLGNSDRSASLALASWHRILAGEQLIRSPD
jgi:hypothetical protein